MLPSGAVFFILITAVVLAAELAWVIALYEHRMLAPTSGGSAPEPTATTGEPATHDRRPG